MTERPLDVVCLGRAAVDLYGQQIGGRLEDMRSFAKYLGGSSGNLAAGLARLNVRSAMLTRVGDDHMGRFVREDLARHGVDVRFVRTDPHRLTGLVILGIGDADDIPHIFFREQCADMGLVEEDVDADFISSARVLAITGTHLSTATTRAAAQRAIQYAKRSGTRVVLDVDYRPVLWGLGAAGDGASRYVESADISTILQSFLPDCDMIVGTEEELAIAGGSTDLLQATRNVRRQSAAVVVLKRGAAGCTVFDVERIDTLDDGIAVDGFPVEIFNTIGAGDAFLAGFLSAWLAQESWSECGRNGNACGALVVARHGCTPAMPSRIELDAFLLRAETPRRPRYDHELLHLHRATTWKDDERPFCVLAFDHRSQFAELAARHGKADSDIAGFKRLIADVLMDVRGDSRAAVRHGAIVDHRYGKAALLQLASRSIWTACPVEVPGSRPLQLDPHFATGHDISTWPGSQAVKCLVFYHPDDDAELRHAQEEQLRQLHASVVALERRLLLEVICPEIDGPTHPDALPRALRRLYNLGIRPDWWKLEAQSAGGWQAVSSVIRECDPHCKGVLILGLGADEETLQSSLTIAASVDICRGFAVGRSIFADAAERWFCGAIDDDAARDSIRQRYRNMIDTWVAARRPNPGTRRDAG